MSCSLCPVGVAAYELIVGNFDIELISSEDGEAHELTMVPPWQLCTTCHELLLNDRSALAYRCAYLYTKVDRSAMQHQQLINKNTARVVEQVYSAMIGDPLPIDELEWDSETDYALDAEFEAWIAEHRPDLFNHDE